MMATATSWSDTVGMSVVVICVLLAFFVYAKYMYRR